MAHTPLSLHPDNPHYFLFRGEPTVLIISGEHDGAVMNRDFDYGPYLDTLAACGFNQTRLFSGTYRELPGSHNIRNNTMAPPPASYLCPWQCVARGPAGEPLKWDLTLALPAGNYDVTWTNPADGRVLKVEHIKGHTGGGRVLRTPIFLEDLALTVVRIAG
ncbi:MAG: hypothetical protein JXC32_04715 [Anaerolineae bacterium]|nr:hypothetical protein [Anaerolineae bacterium]